ncbi:MAG: hypothetical protein CVU43_04965 [Chloroflexi bacterium HGW-Chloroflexi-5]|jgi:hypothetical protein|nr:MAG: hypothetical protein CVU43_04965 [Chloroflexi bacterium HGW-Chloroflexi-5]
MKTKTIWWVVGIFLVISFFAPTIVQSLFLMGNTTTLVLSKSFQPSTILDFWGATLGALATVLLGALAFSQNKKFKEENDQAQEKLNNAVNKLADANRIIAETHQSLLILTEQTKNENEKSQERLNNAVDQLAEANKIIATTDTKLLLLEEQNQRIQLILAQGYIPFLEIDKCEISVNPCEAPSSNRYLMTQDGEPRASSHKSQKYEKQIRFIVEMVHKTLLGGYLAADIEIYLLHRSRAFISRVEINSIRFITQSSKLELVKKEIEGITAIIAPDFSNCDWAIFNIHLVFHDDNRNIFQQEYKIEIEFLVFLSVGISYKERVLLNSKDFPASTNANYYLEAQ